MVEESNPPENVEKNEPKQAPTQSEPVKVFTVESILFQKLTNWIPSKHV